MNINCFSRPNKPLTCKRPNFDIDVPVVDIEAPKLLTVDSSTECHTTPDDVASLMVEYIDYQPHMTVLEPQCGTGQLINALIDSGINYGYICGIEKHYSLVEFCQNRFSQHQFMKINQGDFLTDFETFDNEYDRVICNPPFKNIIKHINQVYKCLKIGGFAICLVPITYKKIDHDVLEILPSDTFTHCKVNTKIIRIIKKTK